MEPCGWAHLEVLLKIPEGFGVVPTLGNPGEPGVGDASVESIHPVRSDGHVLGAMK